MIEENSELKELNSQEKDSSVEIVASTTGPVSSLLKNENLTHNTLESDHLGIEIISVEPSNLINIVSFLKTKGFNYLQCQGGYDEGPGKNLVCFYNLISMIDIEKINKPKEVRIKVFLSRTGKLTVPSLYSLFRGADWQERETYDMFGINFEGHPHPKRLLMPEDWKGWPLRKDYIQPDFYEMQDAY
tara:strand:+ start:8629 stop:9189 length:561 start_codon:yes stop_codon:yes gene_type:complete